MSWEQLGFASLLGFATMATPGPANLSLMVVGASVGFQRTRPYLFGVWVGGVGVTVLVGLGVGALLQAEPLLYRVLQLIGFAYITWLAWQLAQMDGDAGSDDAHAERSFWAGVALHPVNPKAYVMNITVFASFVVSGADYGAQAMLLGVALTAIMVVCTSAWALGGDMLRHWLTRARYARALRQLLALAMVVSVAVPIVLT